jgi:hypothetical protein
MRFRFVTRVGQVTAYKKYVGRFRNFLKELYPFSLVAFTNMDIAHRGDSGFFSALHPKPF